ncbi:hypothetical protein QVD17_05010 [Tagetes erecta]|uniref:C3H1-type domain-containing protein n=1 Tax=Tagetes erecta TaxID=13708 RepID=A0AAD8LE85_TARER|nr:hypothetical protein QVD17_05010 [Tagetes erecta]
MLGKGEIKLRIGFENPQKTFWVQSSGTAFYNTPQVDWACPPRYLVDPDWKIEAGSESQETHIQLHRESRTVEAIYYRKSDIPPNPYVASNALDFNDVSRIPVIPLNVINDETSPDGLLISPGSTAKIGEISTQSLLPRDEVIGAAAVALVALIKSKEPGSQINLELLMKLLSNPGMPDQLIKEHEHLSNQSSVITLAQPHERSSVLVSNPRLAVGCYGPESQNPRPNKNVDMSKIRKLINEYGVHLQSDTVTPGPTVVKDANYYRRLVSLHGMSQENDRPQRSVKPIGFQEQRPCVYFNSLKGCRHGSCCKFQHVKVGLGKVLRESKNDKVSKRARLPGRNLARCT